MLKIRPHLPLGRFRGIFRILTATFQLLKHGFEAEMLIFKQF